ncbi:MAG: acyl-CoA dehydratase activase-related protein [candidate division WOR-3 bacterium]
MTRRIGICRALDGFRFLDKWQSFLTDLGFEVVVSRVTDRQTIEAGARIAPAELCLPAKVYLGHALSLRCQVDALFVPRLVCRKLDHDLYFGCPKAMALPDMVRALIPELPQVEFVLDERTGSEEESYQRLARRLKTGWTASKLRKAASPDRGWHPQIAGTGLTLRSKLQQRYENTENTEPTPNSRLSMGGTKGLCQPCIGVVGHDYLVDDKVLSLNLVEKLKDLGLRPVRKTDFEPKPRQSNKNYPILQPAFMPNWMFERELIRAALDMAAERTVMGLVLATSFACGTSAVTNELIHRAVARARSDLPVLTVIFDEHTAEAGLQTRLESFAELLQMRQNATLQASRHERLWDSLTRQRQ